MVQILFGVFFQLNLSSTTKSNKNNNCFFLESGSASRKLANQSLGQVVKGTTYPNLLKKSKSGEGNSLLYTTIPALCDTGF